MPQTGMTPRRVYRIPPSFTGAPHTNRPRTNFITPLLSLLAIIALLHLIAAVHANTTSAAPPSDCDTLLHSTDYTKFLQLTAGQQSLGALQQVNQLLGGQPAILVPVVSNSAQHTLDVYIYGCTILHHNPTLTLLFKQQGLLQGTFSISQANTLILSSADPTLASQEIMLMPPAQTNIYREYAWRQGHFVQVLFPSLYPVLSRGEAEALQQQEDGGQQLPWTDPLFTAQQMVKDLLHWSNSSVNDRVLDNDGITAHVELMQQQPNITLTVTLKRLIQANDSGLWFVTAAQSPNITLNIKQAQDNTTPTITSPTTISGTITAGNTSGDTLSVTLFDHTLTPMSALLASNLSLHTDGSYTGQIVYTSNQPSQPGLLLVEATPTRGSTAVGQLLLRDVIIS